ncbi:MAG: extracellular solute-binding protein [Chloroflexi bacterium]|nr:extracellular solute-binding protein [Chloroflexota bacterium]
MLSNSHWQSTGRRVLERVSGSAPPLPEARSRREFLLTLAGVTGGVLALSACGGVAATTASATTATITKTVASTATVTHTATSTVTQKASTVTVSRAATAPAKPVVTVTEWSGWGVGGPEEKAFEAGVAKFNATHPDIHVVVTPGVGLTTKTEVAIAAGTPPDTGVPMGGGFLSGWAASGAVQPLDSYIAATKLDTKVYVPGIFQEGIYQGKVYGLPLLFNDRAFLWNKNEFQAAGFPADKPPATLEDFLSYAVELTKASANGSLTQLGFTGGFPRLPGDYPGFSLYATAFGAALFNADMTQVTCDSAACIDTMNWMYSFIPREHGYAAIEAFHKSWQHLDPEEADIAMNVDGEWKARSSPSFHPSAHGYVPLPPPKAQPNRKGTTDVDGHQLFITKGAKEPEATFTFLSWITTDEPTAIAMAQASSNLPQLLSTLDAPELRKNPAFAVYLDIAKGPNAQPAPVIPIWGDYWHALWEATDKVFKGTTTAQVALGDVKQVIQAKLDTYLKTVK